MYQCLWIESELSSRYCQLYPEGLGIDRLWGERLWTFGVHSMYQDLIDPTKLAEAVISAQELAVLGFEVLGCVQAAGYVRFLQGWPSDWSKIRSLYNIEVYSSMD